MALLLIVLLVPAPGQDKSEVRGSRHDVTKNNPSPDRVCGHCHTATSNTESGQDSASALWNSALPLSSSYEPYSEIIGLENLADEPNHEQLKNLCLGCHDGTVAMNTFEHPAGLSYEKGRQFWQEQSEKEKSPKHMCAMCHDPHRGDKRSFLISTYSSGTICFRCHP